MDIVNDDFYMRLALQMARSTSGQTGVNPMVGCVVVKEGRIVGMGAHLRMGSDHAEVHALRMAGPEAAGSTVYVTLEPCSHFGRTPPCCDRLIAERVARVVVACNDPNPRVAGTGIRRLLEAGIAVKTGVLAEEAAALNEKFIKYIVTRQPFVTLKTASTLDGKIASATGDSKWITNEQSRAFVHTLRHQHQAIMVGVGTVLTDDPQLTARLSVTGLHPVRIVIDSMLRTPVDARVLSLEEAPTILVTTERAPMERLQALTAAGAEILVAGAGPRVDLALALKLIGEREIGSILLEGGGLLNGAMIRQGLVDKCFLFFAPKIIGGAEAPDSFRFEGFARMQEAIRLERIKVEMFGDDICLIGYPQYSREQT